MRLMNALLGRTPHSLLFRNVREKLSLCYYCASSFDRHKGVLLVDSGVEEANAVRVADWYLGQANRETPLSPEDAASEIAAVTAEEVARAAESLRPDTVYLLAGEE